MEIDLAIQRSLTVLADTLAVGSGVLGPSIRLNMVLLEDGYPFSGTML